MQNSAKYSQKGCILDNTNSVGGHVCIRRHKVDRHRARTKVYNKVVSQFEAGEVLETFEGHVADYLD